MIIHFNQAKLKQFDVLAQKIVLHPEDYIWFDSVSDFFKATWLLEFPAGTTWSATGLDDGAEEFYALIEYKNHFLKIHQSHQLSVTCGMYE